ncbi:MAG: LacI family DNA-binding transcriptional regulator [Candidatus Eisenbacteria bacterium]
MATIKDVAREAGVSTATVSRVYNGSHLVSADTTRRVLEVAARMDYWPNGAARSLSTRSTRAIGVLLPDLHGEFFSETIRGIDHAAREESYQILLSSSHADAGQLISAARALRGRIDGLIAMAPDKGSAQAMEDFAKHFPVVLLNPGLPVNSCGSISVANGEGAYAMVSHLIRVGHRRIAMLMGPAGNADAEERLGGYRKALADGGGEITPSLEIAGDFSQLSGYESAREILRREPRPTAVFAANDYMAIGLISALLEHGVRVPRDMAVTGFDDIELARYLSPPLTTVRVDAYGLGERAVIQWLEAVRANGEGRPKQEVLLTTLVVRGSCGAAGRRKSGD